MMPNIPDSAVADVGNSRKIILCALETRQYQKARQTFLQMSEMCKRDPLTRYLMYRVALQEDDIALGMSSVYATSDEVAYLT